MAIASQDYRDGVAHGSAEIVRRILNAQANGIELEPRQMLAMASQLGHAEYGGREPEPRGADS